VLPGKLPPLLAADDSSQILNRKFGSKFGSQGTYDGRSFLPSPRDSSIHSKQVSAQSGGRRNESSMDICFIL